MTDANLPDIERRNELEDHLESIRKAARRLPDEDQVGPANIGAARDVIDEAMRTLEDELAAIGEIDSQTVRELVLEHTGRTATTTERVDNEVVLRFEHGPMGDETECRYAVAVTSGNEWFHIEDDDGNWVEAWRN